MNKEIKQETIIASILIITIILLLNPFNFWMPDNLMYIMLTGVTVLFVLFVSFVWKEKAADEREQLHVFMSGRIAYLSGISVLVAGVLYQGITDHIDPWLLVALAAMVIAKTASFIYSRNHL